MGKFLRHIIKLNPTHILKKKIQDIEQTIWYDPICVFKKLFYTHTHTHKEMLVYVEMYGKVHNEGQGWEIGISRIIFIKIYIFLYLIIESSCIVILVLSKNMIILMICPLWVY